MKKFRFPLERVLDWRASQVQLEEARLAGLLFKRQAIEARRAEALGEGAAAAAAARRNGVTGAELATMPAFQNALAARLGRLAAEQRECDEKLTAQRAALTEARRQEKLLENLKRRRRQAWEHGAARAAETEAGDLYLAGMIRRRIGTRGESALAAADPPA